MKMLVTGALVLAAGAWALPQEPAKPAPAKPLKIGFVNVKQVVDKYKRVEHENELIRKRGVRLNDKIKEMESTLEESGKKLELYDPGSLKYEDTKREILKLEQDIKFEKEWARFRIGTDGARVLVEIYKQILDAVREHATREGYTLVLKIEDEKMDTDRRFEVELLVNLRGVLFHDADHDITKPVIDALNAKWDKVKPPPGQAPPDQEPKDDKGAGAAGGGAEKPASDGAKKD